MSDPFNQNQGGNPVHDQYLQSQTKYLDQMTANSKFGFNMNTFNNAIGGISAIGSLWGAWEDRKMAKKQWKLQKSVLKTNMMNQIQSYNNSLRDKLDTRAHMEGRDQASADKQFEERQARRYS